MHFKKYRISKDFFTSAVRNSMFDIQYLKSNLLNSLKLALMGFHPGLCCCALSALGFVFSSLEAHSQQSRSKKYAALAGTVALPAAPGAPNL
jgi:hypothetical protein